MALVDEIREMEKGGGGGQQQGQALGQQLDRPSLLQEFVDSNGTNGLNADYVNKALSFDGGFGAFIGGYIPGDDGRIYMRNYQAEAERLRRLTKPIVTPEDYVSKMLAREGYDMPEVETDYAKRLAELRGENEQAEATYQQASGNTAWSGILKLIGVGAQQAQMAQAGVTPTAEQARTLAEQSVEYGKTVAAGRGDVDVDTADRRRRELQADLQTMETTDRYIDDLTRIGLGNHDRLIEATTAAMEAAQTRGDRSSAREYQRLIDLYNEQKLSFEQAADAKGWFEEWDAAHPGGGEDAYQEAVRENEEAYQAWANGSTGGYVPMERSEARARVAEEYREELRDGVDKGYGIGQEMLAQYRESHNGDDPTDIEAAIDWYLQTDEIRAEIDRVVDGMHLDIEGTAVHGGITDEERQRLAQARYKAAAILDHAKQLRFADVPEREDFTTGADRGREQFQDDRKAHTAYLSDEDENDPNAGTYIPSDEDWRRYVQEREDLADEAEAAGYTGDELYDYVRLGLDQWLRDWRADAANASRWDTRYSGDIAEPDDRWTDEEKNVYYYLYSSDPDRAREYALTVRQQYNAEEEAERRRGTQEYSTRNFATGALSTLGAIPGHLFGGLYDYAKMAAERSYRGGIYDSQYTGISKWADDVTGSISQKLNEYGTIPQDSFFGKYMGLGGKGIGDLYSVFYSMAESAASIALGGDSASLVMFFGSAAASTTRDMLNRGVDPEKALRTGLAAGCAEAMFERLSIENLLNEDTLVDFFKKGVLRIVLKQGGVEASEEFFTEISNEFMDRWINGGKSEYASRIYALQVQGMSYEDAKKQAGREVLHKIWDASLSGFLSGLGMSAGHYMRYSVPAHARTYEGDVKPLTAAASLTERGSLANRYGAQVEKQMGRRGSVSQFQAEKLEALVNDQYKPSSITEGIRHVMNTARKTKAAETAEAKPAEQKITGAQRRQEESGAVETVRGMADFASGKTESLPAGASEMTREQAESEIVTLAKNLGLEDGDASESADDYLKRAVDRVQSFATVMEQSVKVEEENEQNRRKAMGEAVDRSFTGLSEEEREKIVSGFDYDSEAADPGDYLKGMYMARLMGENGATLKQAQAVMEAMGDMFSTAGISGEQFRTAWKIGHAHSGSDYASIGDFAAQYPAPDSVTEIFNMDEGMDLYDFTVGFRAAYDMGRSGVSEAHVTEDTAPYLTEQQRKAAYELGQEAADKKAQKRSDKIDEIRRTGKLERKKGTVRGVGVTIAELRKKFNDPQRISYRFLSRFAELTGVDIVLYESETDEHGNFAATQGEFRWKDDTIYIDINSGLFSSGDVNELGKYTMLRTFSHEFTHFIEKWNAKGYNEFRKFVFSTMKKQGVNVNDLIETKMGELNMSEDEYEQASREVVADSMMDILPDSRLVQNLAEEHPNIFKTLLRKLKQFVGRLKQYYKGISTKIPEAELLKNSGAYLDDIVRMWDDIAKTAVENYQSANGQERTEPETRRAGMDFFRNVEETGEEAPNLRQMAAKNNRTVGRDRFPANDFTSQAENGPELRGMAQQAPAASRDRFPANDFTSQAEAGPDLKSMVPRAESAPSETQETQAAKGEAETPAATETPAQEESAPQDTQEGARLQQLLNVYISNIKNAASKAGIDLRAFFNATAEMDAYHLNDTDLRVVVQMLSPVVDQLEVQGNSSARQYLNAIAKQAGLEETIQETEETLPEAPTVSEVIKAAEEHDTPVEPVPPKAETEKAKAKLKKGVSVPVEKANAEAILHGLETKQLSLDNITLTGTVRGFNVEQRAHLIEALINGYYAGKKTVKIDVPYDGKFELSTYDYNVVKVLTMLKAKVTQDVIFNKKLDSLIRSGERPTVVKLNGEWFISASGRELIPITQDAVDYATSAEGYKAKVSSLSGGIDQILSSNYTSIDKAPVEVKFSNGSSFYRFGEEGDYLYIPKETFRYFDGGNLYRANFSVYKNMSGERTDFSSMRIDNPDGTTMGYILGQPINPSLREQNVLPTNLKSFSKKATDTRKKAAETPASRKIIEKMPKEAETNGTEETAETAAAPVGAETDADRYGDGTVRVPAELQTGDVQRDAAGREPAAVPAGERLGSGRDDNRSDAKRNGRSRSQGTGESGVQPGRSGSRDSGRGTDAVSQQEAAAPMTEEEQERQHEALHETTTQQVEQKSTEAAGGNNYQIGESLDLPNGSKARFRANVDAIRLVKQLEAEGRNATAEEQAVLARYVGWGGISEAFDERKGEWSKEYAELKELLTDEEYKAAKGSTLNAHYTSIPVIRAMYRGLEKLGFKGGRMLEPSSGVGNFVGAMPASMTGNVRSWTMVELDNITGLIAKHLYPQNDVRIEGFEKTILPDNYMDVAIGNVPFGNYPVVDRAYPKKLTSAIHNYFFAKSLDKVRPGGIVMFITSSYTMNANDRTVRNYISKQADLLGAIRLPNTAFAGNAGTSVVTDILVLKKRAPGTEYAGVPFVETQYDYKFGYQNEYFKAHPDMVLGEEVTTRGMHYRDEYSVNPYTDRGSLEEQIDKAFQQITGQMDYPAQLSPEKTNYRVQRAEKGTKQGGYVQREGKLYQNDGGELREVQTDEKTAKRITGMLGIRDVARELMNAQQQGVNEKSTKALRRSLNKAYDAFVKEYGFLNSPANRKAFQGDPDRYSLYALENWDAEKKTATKADIFTTDTIKPNQTITHADTVKDALAICRNTIGSIDVQVIAQLTGRTQEDVTRELIDSELAFKTTDGQLEPAETYLSGNVRAKLRDAQGLVGIDKDYQHNIDALKAVVPADIPHEQIFVQPGTPWIPESVYSDFAAFILGGNNHRYYGGPDIAVHRSNQTGTFTIDLNNKRLKTNYQNMQEWGTPKRSFLNLLEAMMNSRSVTVTYKDNEGHTIVDRVATDAANEKIEQITKKFQEWLWQDEERTRDLEYLYNETFNNLVTPKYDGSTLTVNGLRAGWSLRPHQADAVQRIVSSGGNTLLAHRVGAGKTLEMAAAAMKLKELGIVQKPMFAVPKSLVAQWGKEFSSYFPAAKLLVAEQSDFTPANRKTFANRIATGNYDAIIVSYEQFEKIPISDSFALQLYQEQVDEIIQAINEAKEEAGAKSMSVKDMEKKRKQLEAKIQKLSDKAKDTDSIEFEQLGIDSIFIDEAHNFKNLFYTTSMNNVSGLGNKDGSKRAFDLYTKVRYLQQLNGGRGVVFATATPVMNSMSEMYIMQKYLQSDLLDQLGLSTFDAWAKQFGEVVNGVEIKPSGQGYRVKQSFSRFKNMGELQLLFRNFADVLTKVPGLKIPKMKGGAVKVVECDAGEFQQEYMKQLEKRADNIKNVDPSEDNMLKITSDGRKISYTQRMIDPSLPYEEGSKLYKCAENIVEEYKASRDVKGTQIVFCDMATPKGRSNNANAAAEEDAGMDTESAKLYDDLKKRLVKLGIPAREIAFIHDADTDAKKSKLFDDMNAGRVRVLIGSTGKMGVGMNAQKRAVAIHHLDAPWRPGDVEQRDGRVFRQGNINEEVSKYVYVTTGSFDARLWDIIDRKSSFIDQIMNGENVGREVEDTGEVTLSAAEVKALASGSPLILEQVQLETDIKKLQNLYMAHRQSVVEAGKKLQEAKQAKAEAETRAANARRDIKHRTEASTDEKFSITVGNKAYTDKKEAGKVLMAYATAKATEETYTKIGTFAGFDVMVMQTKEGIIGLLKADGAYRFNTYPDNTTLMITNMQKVLNGLDNAVQAQEELARQKAQEIKAQEAMMRSPFPRQAELDQKRQRYNEVMEELNPKEEQAIDSGEDEDEDRTEYSIRRSQTIPYRDQIKSMFGKGRQILNRVDDIYVHGAVKTGIDTGLDGKPFFLLKRNFGKITRQEGSNDNYSAHGIGEETMLRIPGHIESPALYVVGNGRVSIIAGEYVKTKKSEAAPLLIGIDPNSSVDGQPANEIKSAYGRDDFANWLVLRASDSKIYAGNERKAAALLRDAGLKMAGPVAYAADLTDRILSMSAENVNTEDLTEQSTRRQTFSDREILEMATDSLDVGTLTPAERTALDIFKNSLDTLRQAQEKRASLGQQYRDEQFTKGGSRAEAEKIHAQMKVLDQSIPQMETRLLELQNKDALKKILVKAREAVETIEKEEGKQKLKQYRERRNESAAVRKYRARVQADVKTLRNWLVNPSSKDIRQHVPAELQKTVADFLESINLMSKTFLNSSGAETTKADQRYLKSMQRLRDAIKKNVDSKGLYSGYADLPEDFMEIFDGLIRKVQDHIDQHTGTFVVNQMTGGELRELSNTLRTLRQYISNMNQFHNNAMFRHAYEAGEETIEHLSELQKSKKGSRAYKFMRFDYMRPSYVFEHFGKGGQSIEHEFREGQAQQAFLANTIIDFAKETYSGREVKAWGDESRSFELENGETVTLPITHIMSLYCLTKRKQAQTHIYGDGIRVANYKEGRKVQLDEGHLVTQADVENITGSLTDRQKQVADALQHFMSTVTSGWGNYVSMIRFGVEQFTEENYFPINSDGRYLSETADESPDNAGLYALLNSSFTKELRENAKNRIILYNVFDVFANHTASMAQYRSFALPVLDALKWFNYQNDDTSVRTKLASAFGAKEDERAGSGSKGYAEQFVINLLKSYNGTSAQGDPYDSMGLKGLHKFNRAQIAYNTRVVIQQPMAVTRAAMILSPAKLAEGLGMSATHLRKLAAEMEEHSGIAAWKALGFYDTNISRGLTELIKQNQSWDEKFVEFGTKGAELADRFTWAAMWYAAKQSVDRSQYESDAEYMKAVTDLFEEVIYKTQVVDSVLTKSEFLRAKGFFPRMLGSFMSEPMTTVSMLTDAYYKYTDDLQRGMSRGQAWRRNGKNIAKTVAVYSIGQILLAAMQAVIDGWRDDDEYDVENPFKNFLMKYLNAFKSNAIEEELPFGKIPLVSEIYDGLKGLLDYTGLFDQLGLDLYGNGLSNGWAQYAKYLQKGFEISWDLINGNQTNYTAYGAAYNLLRGTSGMVGLPIATLMREVVDLWNNTAGWYAPDKRLVSYQRSTDRKYLEHVRPAGISLKTYERILTDADAAGDGLGSTSQDELGQYLIDLINAGEITQAQAQAIWDSRGWKSSFATWRDESAKKAAAAAEHSRRIAATGLTEERYETIMTAANTDGKGNSPNQGELGTYLLAGIRSGTLSDTAAQGIWNTMGWKTSFADWQRKNT